MVINAHSTGCYPRNMYQSFLYTRQIKELESPLEKELRRDNNAKTLLYPITFPVICPPCDRDGFHQE